MKRSTSLLMAGCLILGSGTAMAANGIKPLLRTPSLSQKRMTPAIPKPAAETQAKLKAQAWLKSIGYDLTLERMETLKTLRLQLYSQHHTPLINDAAMVHLKVLPNLETLALPRQIGDAGLAYVKGLNHLTTLNMPDCRITDAGLAYIKNLTGLRSLVISANENLTDAGVAQLAGLTNLEILNLNNARITDAATGYLANMKGMRKLFLSRTPITDAAVDNLLGFPYLERLDIQGTQISAAGLAKLKAAYPHTTIYR